MILILLSKIAFSLNVYETSNKMKAQISLSPAPTVYGAECTIYVAENSHDNSDSVWNFVDSKHEADLIVYFYGSYNRNADIQYAFVKYKSRAKCSL
tara:strand:- start:286 stop:573 length:288 start_codon:yes stop_codon:yes gene_type:complete